MINKIKNWWIRENKEIDKRLDIAILGLWDNLIRKPILYVMIYEMKKAEHECRVNLLVYERVPRDLMHEDSITKSQSPHSATAKVRGMDEHIEDDA